MRHFFRITISSNVERDASNEMVSELTNEECEIKNYENF